MSIAPTPTTELQAVNAMLQDIGESAVLDLEDELQEVQVARTILTQTVLEVCAHGWQFNTETFLMERETGTCRIKVPEGTLSIDAEDPYLKVTQRGDYLYDLENHTFEFANPVRCTVVLSVAFDCLPQHAKQYVMARAGRLFSERILGAENSSRFTSDYEMTNWRLFRRIEGSHGDYNILHGSQGSRRILDRYPRSRRR